MKVTVLHDEQGRILAISTDVDLKTSGSKFTNVGMLPGPGQQKLETELSGEPDQRALLELHRHFRVDRATSKLVKID
jgi:hypothetical protein